MTDEKWAPKGPDKETALLHELTGRIGSGESPFIANVYVAVYYSPEGRLRVGASAYVQPSMPLEVYELLADRLMALASEMRQGRLRGH